MENEDVRRLGDMNIEFNCKESGKNEIHCELRFESEDNKAKCMLSAEAVIMLKDDEIGFRGFAVVYGNDECEKRLEKTRKAMENPEFWKKILEKI